jgi:hypothetical protein
VYLSVKAVKPLKDYKLLLTFENGEERVFDLRPYLNVGIFAELKQPGRFEAVRVSFDTVEWPNGADICPELLYEQSTPVNESLAAQLG